MWGGAGRSEIDRRPNSSTPFQGIPEDETGSSVGTTGILLDTVSFMLWYRRARVFLLYLGMGPALGGREGGRAVTLLLAEFLMFPTGCRWLQASLPEAPLPIYLPTPLNASLRNWYRSLVRTSMLLWGERIDPPHREKNSLK